MRYCPTCGRGARSPWTEPGGLRTLAAATLAKEAAEPLLVVAAFPPSIRCAVNEI